jgi:hypothetical protein
MVMHLNQRGLVGDGTHPGTKELAFDMEVLTEDAQLFDGLHIGSGEELTVGEVDGPHFRVVEEFLLCDIELGLEHVLFELFDVLVLGDGRETRGLVGGLGGRNFGFGGTALV